jgi:hypothetical protein
VIRAILVLMALVGTLPAAAQTALSPAPGSAGGGVGSATLRNGYPAGGGSVVLPALPNPSPAAGAVAAGASVAGVVGGATGRGGGGSGRAAVPGAASGSGRASGRSGGGNFVLCPPSDASGEAAFLIGTDLSCAPQ